MDELAALFLSHKTITYDEVTGTGKARVTFDRVPIDKALIYAAEDADVTLRLHHFFKRRLVPERMTTLYETIERKLVPVVAGMERAGIKVDRPALKALSRTIRPAPGGTRNGNPPSCRAQLQCRLAQATGAGSIR